MKKINSAVLSIASNSMLIIFKLTAGITMNSISVLSEGVHSSIDLIASLIAFFSIKKSSLKEDDDHPFGHGKYENVSGFVEAILIMFAAIMIIYEAFNKLVSNSHVKNIDSGIYIMLISSAVNLFISIILLKSSKDTNSIALEADGMHLFTDFFTSLGVFLGLVLLKLTNIKIIDSITAFLVAILIIKTAVDLIKKSLRDLVDSSLDKDDINKIVKIVKKYPNIKEYHKLRTRRCGNTREIDIHIQIVGTDSLKETHDICSSIEDEIRRVFPDSCTVIHAEPYIEKFHKKSLT
ncbi:cation diffusion facilitator family transporter [Clostridium acetobutylicum]|uniref:Cation efflux system protein n=1 Tax=Clostridium acetobutylicum (strain ATCC 824 / DSM 792 / JCM 1419 / IAM 19013 / LMG 5710 / NBRC 13948 / NRRL B-527 / VKM B-1787 / 2291 / W) TaxID=272562 RepID=Q97K27_CLOAB|nr:MULTISPECIES: cation diffusion facilitator family transporter [Clostridium]AAK79068.1 Cation efflux system protein [Clostridium acetobutylicum ATCC 824]ADZ20143.1 Cation efflux system protein [Clostridium acetobutylicum EA 2018]AEI33875.1 cation efflux system protein [Clostridium acetobutylicum DSM 1731]AWV81677.1 cation transporter [Clostridium acetobutylicum]MBC2395216.1 cation transporter [Clostridium acetobutylicum]